MRLVRGKQCNRQTQSAAFHAQSTETRFEKTKTMAYLTQKETQKKGIYLHRNLKNSKEE